MKIYRIFLKKGKKGVIEDLQVLKEGFNIKVIILNFIYLLYNQLWLHSCLMFLIFIFCIT